MPSPQRSRPLILGAGIVTSYSILAALAAVRFPRPFGPWHDNTLSQLGNPDLNPDGYILYLAGCAVAGALTITLFAGPHRWVSPGARGQRRLLFIVRSLGTVGGFALIMNAVFPENLYAAHHFWAGVLFNAFAVAALIAIPALWRRGRSNSGLVAYNAAVFFAVILMFVFADHHWMEWLPACLLLLFPLLLGVYSAESAQDSGYDCIPKQRVS